jgi:ABC-type nitrate/sulfonate/bicarbonate transport system permease component
VGRDRHRFDRTAVPAATVRRAAKGWLLATSGYMDSTLWQHLGASLSRIGLGLGFAVLTAVPVGIAIGPTASPAAFSTR